MPCGPSCTWPTWRPEAHTTAQIADATKVPKDYLSKILQGLAREGIVRTSAASAAASSLAKDPAEISILDVVNAVEPESVRRITTCPLGLKTHGVRLCPLHKRLDDAVALVENAFRNTTLAEVLAEPSESVPLCETPDAAKLRLRKRDHCAGDWPAAWRAFRAWMNELTQSPTNVRQMAVVSAAEMTAGSEKFTSVPFAMLDDGVGSAEPAE